MNLLYLSLSPHMGLADPLGYGTHMREVARALEERGHEVRRYIAADGGVVARAAVRPPRVEGARGDPPARASARRSSSRPGAGAGRSPAPPPRRGTCSAICASSGTNARRRAGSHPSSLT